MRVLLILVMGLQVSIAVHPDWGRRECFLQESEEIITDSIGNICKDALVVYSDLNVTDVSNMDNYFLRVFGGSLTTFKVKYFKMVNAKAYKTKNKYSYFYAHMQAARVEIRGNKYLNELNIIFEKYEELRISGNPKLKIDRESWIGDVKNSEKVYVQEAGECEFDNAITDLEELNECKYVRGDLKMNENTTGNFTRKLEKITGCFQMINTPLANAAMLENIGTFAEKCETGGISEISGNRNLWIHPLQRRHLEQNGKIVIKIHPDSVGECTTQQIFSKDFACTRVDNVVLDGNAESLHNLQTINFIKGYVQIKNSNIEKLEMPELTEIPGEADGYSLSILNNKELVTIAMPKLKRVEKGISILSNYKLQETSPLYTQLSKLAGDNKMNFDCNVAGKLVSDLSDFDSCTTITGGLHLENTKGQTTRKVSLIDGCLKVIDTELSDLSFLNLDSKQTTPCSTVSEIRGNKKLCLLWPDLKRLQEAIGKIDYKPDESCKLHCSLEEFKESSENACNQFVGDLVIEKLDSKTIAGSPLSPVMAKVKHIKGKLTISGNEDVSIDFPLLETVDNSGGSGEAILIQGDDKLKALAMPNLKSVASKGETSVLIKGFKMDKDQAKILENAVGDKKIIHECDLKGVVVSAFSQIDSCTEIVGDLILEKTTGGPPTTLRSIGGCLKIQGAFLENLDFLNSLDPKKPSKCAKGSEISGNRRICDRWSVFKGLQEKFGQKISYIPDDECLLPCSIEEFGEVDQDICNQIEDALTITGLTASNLQASPLSKIMANVREIKGNLIISGNDGVKIDFPKLEKTGAIVVTGDWKLTGFSMPKLKSADTEENPAISVKGCEITKEQRKILSNAAGHKKFKLECDPSNKPISQISELEYCTWIKGDLLFHNTTGYITIAIESISGCLQMINTDLRQFEFMALESPSKSEKCQSGEKSIIKDNKSLCPTWTKIKKLRNDFGQEIDISIYETCQLVCKADEFAEEGSYCDYINDDLKITESTGATVAKAIFTKLKGLGGSLSITNTTLEEIWFAQLQKIIDDKIHSADVYSISVVGNNGLRELLMPNLKTINSSKPVAVFISENNKFRLPDKTKHILEEVLGSKEKIIYECHESVEIHQFSRLEGCSRMSSDLHLKGEITGNRPFSHISHVQGCLRIESTSLNALDFLDLKKVGGESCVGGHYIKDNKDLCVSPFSSREMKKLYKDLEISGNKPRDQCPVFCVAVNGTIPDHECNVVEGEVRIENNCSFNQDLAVVQEIRGGLVISNCSLTSLESVLPELQNISSSGIPLVLENIEGYSNVTDLSQINLYSEGLLLKLSIVSEVPYMDSADLKAHFGSKRVEIANVESPKDGVCVFVDPAVKVENCSTVEGDLVLDETSVSVSLELQEITGCLTVSNTKLKSYEFLTKIGKVGKKCRWTDAETEISNNSCIPYSIRKATSGMISEKVEKEDNKKECYECSGGLTSGQVCNIIIGNLEVSESSNPETAKQLENVKEIYGRLIIKNSNLPEITLSQLTKVEAPDSQEPAIEVTGNKELSSLDMPSLSTIKSKGPVQVKIADNQKLKKSSELMEQLAKATGTECGEKEGACQFAQVKEPQKVKATTDKSTEGKGFTLIPKVLLASGGVCLVICVISTIGFVVAKKIKAKQDKEDEEKDKKKKKKGKGKGKKSTTKKSTKTKSTAKSEEKVDKTEEKSGSPKKTVSKEPEQDGKPEKSKETLEQKSKEVVKQEKSDDFFNIPGAPADENNAPV